MDDLLFTVNENTTVNFFMGIAGIAFGICSIAGALEIIKKAEKKDEELRYLNSILYLSFFTIIFAFLPLATSFNKEMTYIYCTVFFFSALPLFVFITYEWVTKKITIKFPLIFYPTYIVTVLAIIISGINAFVFGSINVYKLCLFWALLVTLIRFTLFVRYLSRQ